MPKENLQNLQNFLGTLEGVSRSAMTSPMPRKKGNGLLLDWEGTLKCSADHLVDFALMGTAFARKILFRAKPSVGLLNGEV